ncbi:MAG: T9SS type A sorting domain-containing protein, partial [Cyclobacteriaceae bacterium]
LKESTTYYYKFYSYLQEGNVIRYSEEATEGSFTTRSAAYVPAMSYYDTYCTGSDITFSYSFEGIAPIDEKPWPVLSKFDNLKDSVLLEIVDSTATEMTVRFPSDYENGFYYFALLHDAEDYKPEVIGLNFGELTDFSVTRTDSTIVATDADTYRWYLNGNLIADETSATIYPATDGVYKVEGDFANCTYESEEVLILPELYLNEPDKFVSYCIGSQITIAFEKFGSFAGKEFTAKLASVSDSIYNVEVTDLVVDGIGDRLTGFVDGDLTVGDYWLYVTENTVGVITEAISISLRLPEPVTITQSGTVLTSSSATDNQWYRDGEPVEGATGQTFTVYNSGEYMVSVSNTTCETFSEPIEMNVTSVNELSAADILQLYPNPAQDVLSLQLSAGFHGSMSVVVISADGKVIRSFDSVVAPQETITLDIGDLSAGVFMIKAVINGRTIVRRLIKE